MLLVCCSEILTRSFVVFISETGEQLVANELSPLSAVTYNDKQYLDVHNLESLKFIISNRVN
jgi:hypothetical protein